MSFLVAINVVASRLPERRPTGTPYARANIDVKISFCFIVDFSYSHFFNQLNE